MARPCTESTPGHRPVHTNHTTCVNCASPKTNTHHVPPVTLHVRVQDQCRGKGISKMLLIISLVHQQPQVSPRSLTAYTPLKPVMSNITKCTWEYQLPHPSSFDRPEAPRQPSWSVQERFSSTQNCIWQSGSFYRVPYRLFNPKFTIFSQTFNTMFFKNQSPDSIDYFSIQL